MTRPIREIAALVLLGAYALLLLAGLIDLAYPTEGTRFADRAGGAFFNLVGITVVLLPLLAVLLATHVQPPVRQAKLIVQVALVEFGVAALFGLVTFLAWLGGSMADAGARNAITGLFSRLATLAIFGVAAYLVFKVWRAVYHVPKPKPQPGLYGQPQQPYGQPGYGQPGQPGFSYGQPYGQPTVPGTAGQQPTGYPAPSFAPGQAPAAPTGPVFGSGGSSSDVTQVAGSYTVPPQPAPSSAPPAPAFPTPSSAPPSPTSLAPTFPDFPKISTSAPA
ncbi:MAG TPA: hypothetical protein VGD43_08320, partial [Micromonospora sp.]